uniref:HV80H14.14B n=1 Tax=Hordeum vulgare TaxID=4513 RepID=Q8L5A2_HORVU|nr:HV80H14.14B [Hordeum vulgare subsp. vulgare]AAM22818.1 hv80H14.14a [Hordeum vulgare subsp. vulgare]
MAVAAANGGEGDTKAAFVRSYDVLKEELLRDHASEYTEYPPVDRPRNAPFLLPCSHFPPCFILLDGAHAATSLQPCPAHSSARAATTLQPRTAAPLPSLRCRCRNAPMESCADMPLTPSYAHDPSFAAASATLFLTLEERKVILEEKKLAMEEHTGLLKWEKYLFFIMDTSTLEEQQKEYVKLAQEEVLIQKRRMAIGGMGATMEGMGDILPTPIKLHMMMRRASMMKTRRRKNRVRMRMKKRRKRKTEMRHDC